MGIPSNYGEIFSILAHNGLIGDNQAKKLSKMAGSRNVLIHEYRNILINKVYDILKNRLSDFDEFAQSILDYLERCER